MKNSNKSKIEKSSTTTDTEALLDYATFIIENVKTNQVRGSAKAKKEIQEFMLNIGLKSLDRYQVFLKALTTRRLK